MKQEDIIRMAREANASFETAESMFKFAALVRADEREACARVCDELHWPWHMGDNSGPKECASAIRARENT